MNLKVTDVSDKRISNLPLIGGALFIVLLALFIRVNLAPIESIPASSSSTVFSAERAKSMLEDVLLNEKPHPLDSAANRITESRLVKLLRGMGYHEEIQATDICHDSGDWGVRCTNVRNIIITIKGSDDSPDNNNGILLVSHYDSVDAGPGASDAGAAVATLLETARLLSLSPQPKNTIILLFNEGEEYGLLGAKAFMQKHPLAKTLKLAINVEARGSKGQSVMFETGENSGWLVNEYRKQTSKPLSSSLFYEVYKILPNNTDLTIFKQHGLQGLNFAHAENLTHYHTPLDNLQNLELGTIQHHGDNVWGVLKVIKDLDLQNENINENNLVYTDILGTFMLQWEENISLVLSIIGLVLFVVSVIRLGKIEPLNSTSISRGVYSFVVLMVAIPVGAYLVQVLVVSLSKSNMPWLTNNFPMQLALWSSLTLIAFNLSRVFTKNQSAMGLMIGLTSCWFLLSLVTSSLAVGISYLFIIPSLIAVLVLLAYPILKDKISNYSQTLIYLVHMMSIAIIFLPVVYTLEIMVTYQMSAAIGVMFGFVLIGFIPMAAIKSTQRMGINIVLLFLFVTGTCWTALQASYNDTSRQALNIYHLQNHKNQSWIIAGHSNNPPTDSLEKVMGELELSSVSPWSRFKRFNVKINSANLASANTVTSETKINENERGILLKVHSENNNLRELVFYVKENTDIRSITFFGNEYLLQGRQTRRNGYYEFKCIGEQCMKSEIIIRKTGDEKSEMLILEALQGLPLVDNNYIDNRGSTAHQSQWGDRTLIISKVEI